MSKLDTFFIPDWVPKFNLSLFFYESSVNDYRNQRLLCSLHIQEHKWSLWRKIEEERFGKTVGMAESSHSMWHVWFSLITDDDFDDILKAVTKQFRPSIYHTPLFHLPCWTVKAWNVPSIILSLRQILIFQSTSISLCRNFWKIMKLLPKWWEALMRRYCRNTTQTYSIQHLTPFLSTEQSQSKTFLTISICHLLGSVLYDSDAEGAEAEEIIPV